MLISLWISCRRSMSIHRIQCCQCSPSSIVVTSKIPISGGERSGEQREERTTFRRKTMTGRTAHAITADGAIETEIEKKRLLPFQTAAWFISPFKFCLESQQEFPRKQCVAKIQIRVRNTNTCEKNQCFWKPRTQSGRAPRQKDFNDMAHNATLT